MPETSAYGVGRLRRGLVHFAVGKSVTALLGFASFALLAIVLPVQDYGVYVTLIATLDLMVVMSTFGVDWVAVRFIPEYRTRSMGAQLRRFVAVLVAIRIASLGAGAFIWWLALGVFLSFFRIEEWHAAATLYVFVLLSEGLARFLRDHVLDSLLLQGLSQLSLVARGATIVVVLTYFASLGEPPPLMAVAQLELAGSLFGLALAAIGTVRYLYRSREVVANAGEWTPPDRTAMARLAWHSYASFIVGLPYGTQALMMLASRMLGITGAAVFGFARNLSEQVKRYMPSSLFVGLIRPAIIARYSEGGNFEQLNRHAVLVYKLSLFMLAPVLVFFTVFGESFLDLLSGGKYRTAHLYAVALLLVLVPFTHRQVLEMVVNTLNKPELWFRATLAALVTLPCAVLLIVLGLGISSLIAAIFCGEVLANTVMIKGLRRRGLPYRVDRAGIARMFGAAAVAILLLAPFRAIDPEPLVVIAAAVASFVAFLAIAYCVKPFSPDERAALNRLIARPVFLW